jgi:hypothetical protein
MIILITISFLALSSFVLHNPNEWISMSKYQLLVAAILIWLFIIVLLYSKHWIQISLIAKSNNTSKIQSKSTKLLFSGILKNLGTGIVGLMIRFLLLRHIFSRLVCYKIIS